MREDCAHPAIERSINLFIVDVRRWLPRAGEGTGAVGVGERQ